MRLPSTLMIWCSGSTLAPYRRTVSPSTSTRPSAISSSQCLRLPRPAAASTFCSRTPPGTSMRESRSPSPNSSSAAPPAGLRPPVPAPRRRGAPCGRRLPPSRALLIAGFPRLLDPLRDLAGLLRGLPGRARGILGRPWGPPSTVRGHLGLPRGLAGLAGGHLDRLGNHPGLVRGLLDLVGEEGGEFWQFVKAGQAEPFQEVPGGPVQDGPGLVFG